MLHLFIVMNSVISRYAECNYTDSHYADYAECRSAECRGTCKASLTKTSAKKLQIFSEKRNLERGDALKTFTLTTDYILS
jgi:hypothetical protein